jgi:hypothetical protein
MASGRKDIYKDAKPFTKGDNRINRKGQPKKLFKKHIDDLKEKGYKPVTSSEFHEMIGLIIGMTEKDLKDFALDNDKPYWVRALMSDLNNKSTRQKLMDSYRDWIFGKAEQSIEVKGLEIHTSEKSKEIIDKLKNDND